jgi:hypothetical protein
MSKRSAGGQPKYTKEQLKFILDARLKLGIEYGEVARRFAAMWGGPRTPEQMRHAFRGAASSVVTRDDGSQETHPFSGFVRSAFDGIVGRAAGEVGRAFITAASPVSHLSEQRGRWKKHGTNIYLPGFHAMETWLEQYSAELVILPMRAHIRPLANQPEHYDPQLEKCRDRMYGEFVVNEHLRAMDVHLNPQQVHPLTGLYRIRGGRSQIIVDGEVIPTRFNQSLIFAHAKQDMESIATGNGSLARALYSTGAITLPEYLPNRIGRIAADGHVLGGLIVEWDHDLFWVRQVQFAADGSFCDVDGYRYMPSGRRKPAKAAAFRPGDIHAGREDVRVLDAQARLCSAVEPVDTFVEDVFDGGSVNPHSRDRLVERAKQPAPFRTLAEEVGYAHALLENLASRYDSDLNIVASNHHDFIERYLESGRYVKDPVNFTIAHRMVGDLLDGRDPLQMRLDPDGKHTWLGTEDDRYVDGVQMASHGHLGPDGARGSAGNLERTLGNAMVGHAHAPRILGKLFIVGHSSVRRHGYNRGPSSWLSTAGIVWPGGQKQLCTIIDGRFGLADQ